jgi:hypothetical protein
MPARKKVAKKKTATKKNTGTSAQRAREIAREKAFARGRKDRGGADYFKLGKGENVFFLVGNPDGPDYVETVVHKGTSNDRFMTVLDLTQVFSNQAIYHMVEERTTDEDCELYAQFGDPCLRLVHKLEKDGVDRSEIRKERNHPLPNYKVMWNVVQDGNVFLWESSTKFFRCIEDEPEWPELLLPRSNTAIRVKGTGDGLQRRYSDPRPFAKQFDGPDPLNLYDLDQQVRRLYMGYKRKASWTLKTFAKQVSWADLAPKDFGVDGIDE